MRHLLLAVFLRHPVQHAAAAVVVEIDVDIGQRNTVRIEETLEQQVVGDGVDLRDAETVGHGRSGRRASSRTHRDVQFLARRADEILHDEEVARETHRLHDVQLEAQPLLLLLGQMLAVAPVRPLHREFGQVVGLELDAVEFVVSAQLLDLLAPLLFGHDHLSVLVARELVEEVLLRQAGAVFLLRAEVGRNGERRHDRRMVDGVALHLVAYIDRRGHRLGVRLAEDRGHFGRRLEPLLLRIEHPFGIVEVLARREADQAVVRLGVVFVHEVHVVGADRAYPVSGGQFAQVSVHLELHGVGLVVGPLDGRLVELELQIVVVAEDPLVPEDRLLGLLHVVGRDRARHFARQTGRAADQSLVVLLDLHAVRTWAHVEALGPRLRDDLDEVVVTLQVLGQQDEVVAALVGLAFLVVQSAARHIDLAADDGFESELALQLCELLLAVGDLRRPGFSAAQLLESFLAVGGLVLELALDLLDIVVELLDAEHVAVVRDGDAGLSVGHGLVHQTLDTGLSVEDRILGMYVKVNELGHCRNVVFAPARRASSPRRSGSADRRPPRPDTHGQR